MGSAKLTHYIAITALAWSHLSVTEASGHGLLALRDGKQVSMEARSHTSE